MKRFMSIIMAAVMVTLLFTGCGEKRNQDNTAQQTAVSETSVDQQEGRELYEFTIFSNLVPPEGLSEVETSFIQMIQDKFNTKIIFEAPAASNYDESIQLTLASGEYPDLMLFFDQNSNVFVDACREGVFIPVNPYLETCDSLMAHSYETSWDALKVLKDERIFAVPRTSMVRVDGLMLRKDWLEAVGVTDFKEGELLTLDEVFDILTRFTEDDPDGNGIDDTYGLSAYANADGNFSIDTFFGAAFGVCSGWREYDGKIIDLKYSKDHDNMKRALEFANRLWKAGVVDPDAATISGDVVRDRFYKGIVGMRTDFAGNLIKYQDVIQEMNPEGELSYIPGVVEKEGDVYSAGSYSTGFWGFWALTREAKKPDRIMEVLDFMLSDEGWTQTKYGVEGVNWYQKDGTLYPLENYKEGIYRNILRRCDDESYFIPLTTPAEDLDRLTGLIASCVAQFRFPLDKGYSPSVAAEPEFIDYNKQMSVQITRIITGDIPVSDWDSILDGWYEAGGDRFVEEMRDYINSGR